MLTGAAVSVVVRRMYYWDLGVSDARLCDSVSVVVRRMYYWDGQGDLEQIDKIRFQ